MSRVTSRHPVLPWRGWTGKEPSSLCPLLAKRILTRDSQPTGNGLLFGSVGESTDIWVYDISRNTLTRLTFEGINQHPVWAPDGSRVAFRSSRDGQLNIYWKPADGSGPAERLTTSEDVQSPSSWSQDGKFLAFYGRSSAEANSPSTNYDIGMLPLEGERKPQPFLQTPFGEGEAVFSPGGHWLAYVSNESGRNEVYVQPYPGPGGKWQISTAGGGEPVWARNGRELFFRNGDEMMAVDVTTEPTFSAGTPRLLFEGTFITSTVFRGNYDVAPDGQRFVMLKPYEQEAGAQQINVVLNWFEELRRRVPAAQ